MNAEQTNCDASRWAMTWPWVGAGATLHFHTDAHAYTIIKVTPKRITMRRDKVKLSASFKPEFDSGGFAGHCTNNELQTWDYELDPEGDVVVASLRKDGRYRLINGTFLVTAGRHEFHDYNF